MKSTLAINSEYVLLRVFCALVNVLPYGVASALARGLGAFAVRVLGFKRRRTLQRIRSVFPEKSERECMKIAVSSLQNLLLTGVEMMRAPKLTRAWMDRHFKDGPMIKDTLQSLVDEGRGVVIMVPHSGNWYMPAWAMACYGVKMFAIAARQRNPKLNAWLSRQYGDIDVLDRDCRDTLVRIKERLEAGQAFAILPDLRVRKRDVVVDFLGAKANVSHAGAMFAVRCGCPVIVAQMVREKGQHVVNGYTVLRPDPQATDRKAEAARITREAMAILSRGVMERPGDWFWYNKRWILEAPEDGFEPQEKKR